MIFDFILSVLARLFVALSTLLPTYSVFPVGLADDIASLMSYLNGWSWLFPISTLLTVFGVIVLVVFVEFLYFTTMYVYALIHASLK